MKTCKQLAMGVAEKIERKKRKQKRRRTIAALCLAAILLPCTTAAVCRHPSVTPLIESLKKAFIKQEEPIEPDELLSVGTTEKNNPSAERYGNPYNPTVIPSIAATPNPSDLV